MTRLRKTPVQKKGTSNAGWFSSLSPMTQDLLCIAFLYLIALVLFRAIVFEDAAFSAGGDSANALSYRHTGEMIRETEGVDPLWSPYVFSGMPTFGNVAYVPKNVSYFESATIGVLRLLFLNSPFSWLVAFYFVGGILMFTLLRVLRFSRPASLIAAIIFMLSPYAIALAGAGHGSKLKALSYLPLAFLLTHLLFQRRDILGFGLLSAAIGTLMLTNHVQIVYYTFLVIGLYTLYHLMVAWRENGLLIAKGTALFTGALALGLCISSYIYLSVYEYSHYSIRGGGTEGAEGALTWEYATNWSFHPMELVTLLVPSFFGLRSPYYWGTMTFTESTIYVGVLPIILSILALMYRPQRITIFFAILTCVALIVSFGKHFAPLYAFLFDYFPFFNKFRSPSTILHLLPFCFGVLSAYGFAALVEPGKAERRIDTTRLARGLVRVGAMLAGLLLLGFLLKSTLYETFAESWLVKAGELQQYQQQYGQRAEQIIAQLKQIRFYGNDQIGGLWGDYLRFSLFTIAFLAAIVAFLKSKIRAAAFSGITLTLLTLDLVTIDEKFVNPVPYAALTEGFRADATIAFLKQQPGQFRVLPLGGENFMNNRYPYHGLHSVGGYSPAKLKIYQTIIDSCLSRSSDPGVPLNMNILNMLNVRYIVGPFQLPSDRFQMVHADQSTRTFTHRNPAALPRAFFVEEAVVAQNDHEVFTMLNSAEFDPRRIAILEKRLPHEVSAAESSHVEMVELKSREITLRAYASSDALLVLSEIYYPAGWAASIDGVEQEIYRTNYILRSVVVPAGSHDIVFRFDPPTYEAGWIASNAAWVISVLCILGGLWRVPAVRDRFSRKKM